jgi:hypothetical protein
MGTGWLVSAWGAGVSTTLLRSSGSPSHRQGLDDPPCETGDCRVNVDLKEDAVAST